MGPAAARNTPPTTPHALWSWVMAYTGVRIARMPVCRGHNAPWESFRDLFLTRPPIALVLGPRGGGKSFLSGLGTHLDSRFRPGHGTRILGGSLAQSEQIYRAIVAFALDGRGPLGTDREAVESLLKTEARYRNGSEVSILAASPKSVRGPHVPTLKLDEVDEIDPELREASMGMCMAKGASPAQVVMTSTWHKVGGPMADLIARGEKGEFPVYRFCAFEVLERCPDSRSGPSLERCPECPIVKWCHEDRKATPLGQPLPPPKAKLSAGHYAIDSLIQKARAVSVRAFEADYLCKGPRPSGLWFKEFDPAIHVRPEAEYDPRLPVHLAIDSGLRTGAVWFQVRESPRDGSHHVSVFADYYADDLPGGAEAHARAIVAVGAVRCNGRREHGSTDPAGNARSPMGTSVLAEYERGGLARLAHWRNYPGSVGDGLALLEALISPAAGPPALTVHPRCKHTADALAGYRRAKRGGVWEDRPEDPQHPHEEMVDSLRGGVVLAMPEGRAKARPYTRRAASSVF